MNVSIRARVAISSCASRLTDSRTHPSFEQLAKEDSLMRTRPLTASLCPEKVAIGVLSDPCPAALLIEYNRISLSAEAVSNKGRTL